MRLGRLALRRLLFMIPLLFGIVTITFFITRLSAGNPATLIAGPFASQETIDNITEQLGLDRSLWAQYVTFLGDATRLDFGTSFFTGDPVQEDLAERLPITFELIILSLILALLLGVSAGAYSAWRSGGPGDIVTRGTSFFLLAIPEFWFGLILIYVFFFRLEWAPPPTGQVTAGDPMPSDITGAVLFDSIITANPAALKVAAGHAALPIVTLGVGLAAPITRLTRSAVLEALSSDYLAFGRACGLPTSRLWRYAVRAALPPIATFAGILLSILIGGAVLVERVFSWGGAAQYAADAVLRNDYPAVQAFVVVAGAISVFVFLLIDLLYTAIDPRVKL